MAYHTKADILKQIDEDVLIQLTDDDDAGVVDDDIITAQIARTDALINGYCGKRYAVPFTTVPEVVNGFAVDISIYGFYGRRKGAPEDVRNRYKDAIDFFKGVASGKNSLGENDPEGSTADAPQMSTSNPERIFTRDKMKGF